MSAPLAVILEGTVEADCPAVEAAEIGENSNEIGAELEKLGYRTAVVSLTLDVTRARDELVKLAPSVVFNLVDSIEGKGNFIAIAPMLLEYLAIPFTGANAASTSSSSDKLISKQILRANNIRTSDWLTEAEIEAGGPELKASYIIKSIMEHASFGLAPDSIVNTRKELKERWAQKKGEYGSEWFAETYIDGREFNLSVLASGDTARGRAMPPAELVFTDEFPKDQPKIVDYAAKWYKDTPEYKGSVRSFTFAKKDEKLLRDLQATAVACWDAFGLAGYARVDFRVDKNNVPYVLEVNSNPFLTAAEGFGVAAAQGGLPFKETIRTIVADAYRRSSKPLPEMLAA